MPGGGAFAQSSSGDNSTASTAQGGPIRLRPTTPPPSVDPKVSQERESSRIPEGGERPASDERGFPLPLKPRPLGEFEQFVKRLAEPQEVKRFGSELMIPTREDAASNSSVPPDYLVAIGDEIVVTLWGSVDADVRAVVERSGRITIPRVGPVLVAGVRYADLADTIRRRVALVFKNFDLSVSLGQLRGVRVYVTGFVERPGAYSVNSLSTVVSALVRAGGPSTAGSFRNIQISRRGQPAFRFDFYDLLLKGDREADRVLQADDVIHVGPVGSQVAIIGSVNRPGIFELRQGDTVTELIEMAGGFTAVADRSRLSIERLDDRSSVRIRQLTLPDTAAVRLTNGDVVRAFSAVEAAISIERQNKRVRIEGEVARPGDYVLPPGSSLNDALRAAGGLTPMAYVFGAEFTRERVRLTQQENYDRALRDLETEFTRVSTTQRITTQDEAAAQATRAGNTTRLIERLRQVRPTGRIVLQLRPDSKDLPDLALEDGDRLYVPPHPTTVGVFGSVFNAGSYLYAEGRTLSDYIRLAGGPTKGADVGSVFVIRSNGSVVSARQRSGWFGMSSGLPDTEAQPGDTVFVPEEIDKTTFVQNAKDWTQILYQFGLGVAAIRVLRN